MPRYFHANALGTGRLAPAPCVWGAGGWSGCGLEIAVRVALGWGELGWVKGESDWSGVEWDRVEWSRCD